MGLRTYAITNKISQAPRYLFTTVRHHLYAVDLGINLYIYRLFAHAIYIYLVVDFAQPIKLLTDIW